MKKQKTENIVYLIVVIVVCFLYCRYGYKLLASFILFPLEFLAKGFNLVNCILCIVLFPLIAYFVGTIIAATCVVACEIPLSVFHFNAPRKDEVTADAFDRAFRYSIVGAIITIVLTVVVYYLAPSQPERTIKSNEYVYLDQREEYHVDKQCTELSGTFRPILASDAENYTRCSRCCAGLIVKFERDKSTDEKQPDLPSQDTSLKDKSSKVESDKTEQVYITSTGSKYHREKCGSGTYYPIDKQEAIDEGYEPCSKCW